MGRPSKYTEAIVKEICERLSKGEPLAAICRDKHMPGVQTVYDWGKANEAVSVAIARARDEGEEAMLADCLEISDTPAERNPMTGGVDSGSVQEKKLRIETRLKLLAKWNPKRWGDKMDLTSGGNPIPAPVIQLAHGPTEENGSNG
jgi:hypothetical protein